MMTIPAVVVEVERKLKTSGSGKPRKAELDATINFYKEDIENFKIDTMTLTNNEMRIKALQHFFSARDASTTEKGSADVMTSPIVRKRGRPARDTQIQVWCP